MRYSPKRYFFNAFCLLITSSLLISCGFHLRGQTSLPESLTTLILTSQSQSPTFDRSLKQALTQAKVTLVTANTNKTIENTNVLELKVLPLDLSQRTLSTSTGNDISTLSQTLKTTYFIRAADGKALYGPRFVSVTNILYNQDEAIDAVNAQQEEQMQKMQQELAEKLLQDLLYAPL